MIKSVFLFNAWMLILLWSSSATARPCREVIAYFPSWKWYSRNQLVNPTSIDYSKYTIINYAFFKPHPNGEVTPFDPLVDKNLLLGSVLPGAPASYARSKDYGQPRWHDPQTSLVKKAHENDVKVLISIGGWTLSEHFSTIAAHAQKRRRFAKSCADMVRIYGIDGVDIDWEYPGYKANGGSKDDRQNFTLLLREIRDTFNELTLETGKHLLLTSAFGVAPNRMAEIEWQKVEPLLDYINLMTYDFYGFDFSVTNHHAPLYSPAVGIEGYDLHSTVRHLTGYYNVPFSKINIGLAFYGKSIKTKGKPGLHVASGRAPDTAIFPNEKGLPMFYTIVEKLHHFYYHWDSLAYAPYLRAKKNNTFVTFEDENSIAHKARYILDYNLAGAIIWDITGDYISGSCTDIIEKNPLAATLKNVLCNGFQSIQRHFETTTAHRSIPSPLPPRWNMHVVFSTTPRTAPLPPVFSQHASKKLRKTERRRKKGHIYYFHQ